MSMSSRKAGRAGSPPQPAAEYCVLQYAGPGLAVVNVGVLLVDRASDTLYTRMRADLRNVAKPNEVEVLALLEDDLRSKAGRMGASALLVVLEDGLSSTLRITDRQPVEVSSFEEALANLYRQHVLSQ